MRYRQLSSTDDYVFGRGNLEFLANTSEAVAQAIKTRLLLWTGQWFLDSDEGTDYLGGILGEGTLPIYDQVIKDRILGTQGVSSIDSYASFLDEKRNLSVQAVVTTIFGQIGLQISSENTPGMLDVNFILDVSTLG